MEPGTITLSEVTQIQEKQVAHVCTPSLVDGITNPLYVRICPDLTPGAMESMHRVKGKDRTGMESSGMQMMQGGGGESKY